MLMRPGYLNHPNEFVKKYRAIAMIASPQWAQHEDGGKIILPPSALGCIAERNFEYPLLFQISNPLFVERVTHCGVLEFTAREGTAVIPFWMMQNIRLDQDGFVTVRTCTLPRATFVKLQPQSVTFLDISNPKAVLEKTLRKYSAMTVGDTIVFKYNEKEYMLEVLELKPQSIARAVSIVEADVNVDFAPPPGYKEPTKKVDVPEKQLEVRKEDLDPSQLHFDDSEESEEEKRPKFHAFSGTGARISGKTDDHPSIISSKNTVSTATAKEEEKPILSQGTVVYKPISEIEAIRKKKQEEYEKAQKAKLDAERKAKEEEEKKKTSHHGSFFWNRSSPEMRAFSFWLCK